MSRRAREFGDPEYVGKLGYSFFSVWLNETVLTNLANCLLSHHVSTLTTLGAQAEDGVERIVWNPAL